MKSKLGRIWSLFDPAVRNSRKSEAAIPKSWLVEVMYPVVSNSSVPADAECLFRRQCPIRSGQEERAMEIDCGKHPCPAKANALPV